MLFFIFHHAGAIKVLWVSSVTVLLVKKMNTLCEHPAGGRMAQSVRVEETAYVVDASAILQSKEAFTMEITASVMMNTVRNSRISNVQVELNFFKVTYLSIIVLYMVLGPVIYTQIQSGSLEGCS